MKIAFVYLCLYTFWSMAWVYKLGFTNNIMGGVFGYALLTISYAAMMFFDVFDQQRDGSQSSETAQKTPKVMNRKPGPCLTLTLQTTTTRTPRKNNSTTKGGGGDDAPSKTRRHAIERSTFEDNALDMTPYMNEKAFNGFDEEQKNVRF